MYEGGRWGAGGGEGGETGRSGTWRGVGVGGVGVGWSERGLRGCCVI